MSSRSIIQSTMIKITILIFGILIVLYFIIARIYWDNEVLKREIELLAIASAVEVEVRNNLALIQAVHENNKLTQEGKIEETKRILQPCLDNLSAYHTGKDLGYYDKDLKTIVAMSPSISESESSSNPYPFLEAFESGKLEFIIDARLMDWDGKGVIAITVPVYNQNKIVGYSWAKLASSNVLYQSSFAYSKVLLMSIALWLLVLIIVKRTLVKIGLSLDAFTRMITDNHLERKDELEKLPELKPVFEKIKNHTEKLQELNTQLETSKDKLVAIMEGISDGLFALDRKGRFTFVNEQTKKIAKKENDDLLGKHLREEFAHLIDSEILSSIQRAMEENKPMVWETQADPENKVYIYHAYPFSQGITVFVRDVTEAKQRDKEMLRLERLNLIGQLAAGISHEVRNPMTTVRGFLQILESRSDSDQNKEYMDLMISEIDRANEIITDFLSLAKANSDCMKRENINEIISRIYPMLQADAYNCNKDIELCLDTVPERELNESEIRQLILNLVRNGLEATPEGGKVSIHTSYQGDRIILAIQDDGKGIPQEIQDRMGTPFTTTKETGTGLGLAISIGIAHRHQAKFEFDTGENGTIFYIIFPLENQQFNV